MLLCFCFAPSLLGSLGLDLDRVFPRFFDRERLLLAFLDFDRLLLFLLDSEVLLFRRLDFERLLPRFCDLERLPVRFLVVDGLFFRLLGFEALLLRFFDFDRSPSCLLWLGFGERFEFLDADGLLFRFFRAGDGLFAAFFGAAAFATSRSITFVAAAFGTSSLLVAHLGLLVSPSSFFFGREPLALRFRDFELRRLLPLDLPLLRFRVREPLRDRDFLCRLELRLRFCLASPSGFPSLLLVDAVFVGNCEPASAPA